jgi:hypothetical protein
MMFVAHKQKISSSAALLISHCGIETFSTWLRSLNVTDLTDEYTLRIHH